MINNLLNNSAEEFLTPNRLKRAFDLLLSCILFPFAAVICFCAAVIYYIVEREHPFFMQSRLGANEQVFTIYKMTTMRAGTADNIATHEVDTNHAVTKVGKILRTTKIDELPQLWNVIRSDMSLVGPRPGLDTQTELTNERRACNVYSVKPGITGLAQIKGVDMSSPIELAECDKQYIQSSSLVGDVKIIVATLFGTFFKAKH